METKMVKEFIRKIYEECDRDTAAEVLAGILMDDSISTYKMFEDLAYRYLDGNDDFRKGMDTAISIITNLNLAELAAEIEKAEKKTKEST